jgi:hypothetical protein
MTETHTTTTYFQQADRAGEMMDSMMQQVMPVDPREQGKRGHRLRVMFKENHVHLSLECLEPEGAVCRLACSEGCEEWQTYNHEHELTDMGECNAVLWITDDTIEEYCEWPPGGSGFPLFDKMPVIIEWDSDTYIWRPVTINDVAENG